MIDLRGDIDQKVLSELFYQYMNVEEDFISDLFAWGETQVGRIFVHEPILSNDDALHVLDYERATEVIKTATHISVGTCYCRHKMHHMDKACDAPMDICMTFNGAAASLTKHNHARLIDIFFVNRGSAVVSGQGFGRLHGNDIAWTHFGSGDDGDLISVKAGYFFGNKLGIGNL